MKWLHLSVFGLLLGVSVAGCEDAATAATTPDASRRADTRSEQARDAGTDAGNDSVDDADREDAASRDIEDSGTQDAQSIDAGDPAGFVVATSQSDPACVDLVVPSQFEATVVDRTGLLRCDDSRADVDSCAGEGDLIAFEYQSDELFFWINFEPELLSAPITEQRLRSLFRWMWYRVMLPQTAGEPLESSRVYLMELAEADVFQFENGRLRVQAHTTLMEMLRWVEPEGPDCFTSDVLPLTCACSYSVTLPVRIDLDFIFPE